MQWSTALRAAALAVGLAGIGGAPAAAQTASDSARVLAAGLDYARDQMVVGADAGPVFVLDTALVGSDPESLSPTVIDVLERSERLVLGDRDDLLACPADEPDWLDRCTLPADTIVVGLGVLRFEDDAARAVVEWWEDSRGVYIARLTLELERRGGRWHVARLVTKEAS